MINLNINNHDWTQSYNMEANFRYIISEQEAYGWFIDQDKMNEVENKLEKMVDKLRNEIIKLSPKRVNKEGELKNPIKKDGASSNALINWYNKLEARLIHISSYVGHFSRVKIESINPESPKQRIEALQKKQWIPTEFNYKVDKYKKPIYDESGKKIPLSPKLTADSVVGIPLGEAMVKYVQVSHRLKLVKGLKDRIRDDGAIGGGANTVGANSGRCLHRNIVNIPRCGEFYGDEIRSLFSHRKDYTLLGADLTALENRLIGHYSYNIDHGEYARRIEKEDPHDRTSKILSVTRTQAKTINYAMSFGCTYHKLKELLNCSAKQAKESHKTWWNDKKPLLILKKKLIEATENRSPMWIKGLDGRKVFCRSKHSLLNTLIQSAGSVVNKFITCEVDKRIKEQNVDAHLVLVYHDEMQLEIKDDKETLDIMKNIIKESIQCCNQHFKFKVAMSMDINIGNNWSETH